MSPGLWPGAFLFWGGGYGMSVLGFDEALAVVLAHAGGEVRPRCERVEPCWMRVGRVLAEEARADRDQPPFARSTRDGFAVRAGEFAAGERPAGSGDAEGGGPVGGLWGAGEALQIMTGAPLPEGVDAVAMVEFVERDGEWVKGVEGRGLVAGENVVAQGSEARAGQVVLGLGTLVGAAEIALAAACGRWRKLMVFAQAEGGDRGYGDELVELGGGPLGGATDLEFKQLCAGGVWCERAGGLA